MWGNMGDFLNEGRRFAARRREGGAGRHATAKGNARKRRRGAVAGAGETTFYVAAIYFSTVRESKLRYAVPVALIASLVGAVTACALVR